MQICQAFAPNDSHFASVLLDRDAIRIANRALISGYQMVIRASTMTAWLVAITKK